jgi:hypothetical protein
VPERSPDGQIVEPFLGAQEGQVLFHVEQVHAPADCPYDHGGGSPSLYDATVAGVNVVGVYGSFMAHTVYYIVEAADIDSLNKFLFPGMKVCTAKITPVSDHPLPRGWEAP